MSSLRLSTRPSSCGSVLACSSVEVAGAVEDALQQRGRPGPGLDELLELLQQRDELLQIAFSERVARSGTSAHAAQRARRTAIRSRSANFSTHASARSPMPRFGDVDDPAQADDVGRVGDDLQVGQRVADLLALVEPHPADDLVGHADPDEHLLEHPGGVVGAVEDRDVLRLRRRPRRRARRSARPPRRPRRARCRRRSPRSARRRRRRSTGSSAAGRCCCAMTALAARRILWVER